MRYYKQLLNHKPEEGQWGDCYRTCLACMLDLKPEEVPHFYDKGVDVQEAIATSKAWLAKRNLGLYMCPYPGEYSIDEILTSIAVNNPGHIHLLSGTVDKDDPQKGHVVVCRDGKVIHNPSGSKIVGPFSDGFYWIEILTYLDPDLMV